MKTLLGYVSIAFAVIGLLSYVLRPAARATVPWYKFAGAVVFFLACGIGLIAIDAEKVEKTASAPVKNAPEARPAPSRDKEQLAQVIHDWKDAFQRREAVGVLWLNLLKANSEKRELDAARVSTLEAALREHMDQCARFVKMRSDVEQISNSRARQDAGVAVALSIARCKDIADFMGAATSAVNPKVMTLTGVTVGQSVNSAYQVYQGQLSGGKEREDQVLQLFPSALKALGMDPELKPY